VAFAAELGVDVEGVGAVEVDVIMLGRGQVRRDLVGDLDAVCPQRVERVAEIGGGPQDTRVGDQSEAQCLVDLVIEMASLDVALMREEQIAPQRMQTLALVELTAYPAT
jgi:hypothetical protein